MAADGGRRRGDWWREQVEPFLTPDIVLFAAALGLACGLATLGTSFEVIVTFFSFGGTAVFIYVLRAWPADEPYRSRKTASSSGSPRKA